MKVKNKSRSWYHWLVVAACCMMSCSAIGITMNCMGIFYTPVAESFGIGRGNVAMYSTIINMVNGLMGPVVAKLMKKIDFKLMLLSGCVILSLGISSLSFANTIWFFYIAAFFIGFGAALMGPISLASILSNWFFEKYGLATGIALSFSGVSGALLTPVFSAVINAAGWRQAYLVAGILAGVLVLPGILFVLRLRPEEKGLLPYGSKGEVAAAQPEETAVPKAKGLLGSPLFFGACAFAFFTASVTSIGAHFPGYAGELQLASSVGALMVSACMVGNVSFKLLLGFLSDLLGEVKACLIIFCSNALALLCLSLIPGGKSFLSLALAFFFGSIYSVAAVGVPLITKRVFGLVNFSAVYSYVSVFPCIGSALMITIIGYIYDAFGSYRIAAGICFAFSLLATALMLLICRGKKGALADR